MPTPQHVQWDPDLRYCLTTHAHSFAVWGTYPTFSLCCHLPGEICSALWSKGRLVYSTPVAVFVLFPTHVEEGPICLASLCTPSTFAWAGGGSSSNGAGGNPLALSTSSSATVLGSAAAAGRAQQMEYADSFYPPPEQRPQGAVTLVRVAKGKLVLMLTSHELTELSLLTHPALRLRHLVVDATAPVPRALAEQIMELALQLAPG